MTEDELFRALPLPDRLRIAAMDLAITGAPRELVAAVWWRAMRPGRTEYRPPLEVGP